MPTILLKSQDDVVFKVDLKVAQMSETLKTMLEAMGCEDDGQPISLPKVSSEIMQIIIKWSEHRAVHDPQKFKEDSDSDDEFMAHSSNTIDAWDKDFLKPLDTCALCELLTACNYLNIKGLMDATAKTLANKIKGKSPEGIREVMGVKYDKES